MNHSVLLSSDLKQRENPGRIDGLAKASGKTMYTDDIKLPDMAYAKVLKSPYAYARIKKINAAEAEKLDGVIKVVTGQDLSYYNTFGRLVCDIPVLARDVARFAGDRIAAVIAEQPDIAEEALALIEVEYEPLLAIVDARQSLLSDAPIIHEEPWNYRNAPTTPSDHPNLQSYSRWSNSEREQMEKAMADCDRVFEHVFDIPSRHQGYLETHICIAHSAEDHVDIWAPNKSPYGLRKQLAQWLETDPKHIRFHRLMIGGDFGGKGSPMDIPLCISLSKIVGRPVKIRMSYAEDLMGANPSHPANIKVQLGVSEDGLIKALYVDSLLDGGAYSGYKPVKGATIKGIQEGGSAYHIPHAFIESRIVYTNTVPKGHIRSPGSTQAMFAVESTIDLAARELGKDPVQFRRDNLLKANVENVFGVKYAEVRSEEILDAALKEYAQIPEPKPPAEGNWVYGTGMCIYNRETHGGKTEMAIEPHHDGSITVWVAFAEQGAGQLTVANNVARNLLNLPQDQMRIRQAELDQLSFDSGVGGSRVTVTASEAVVQVCEKFISKLRTVYDLPEDYSNEEWVRAVSRLAQVSGGEWVKALQDYTTIPPINSTCVQIARVRVDQDTGEVVVVDFITAVDTGNIINPLSHQVQIEGGIVHGYCDAMFADLEIDDGKVTAANLGEYKLPSIRDLPRLTVRVLEGGQGIGQQNVKAIGELTNPGVTPAIANAIADAADVRLHSMPLKAENVYFALHHAIGRGNE